jgi:hypothetical protein
MRSSSEAAAALLARRASPATIATKSGNIWGRTLLDATFRSLVPQKKRIEAAEMKLLRPLAGYTLRDHKYNDDTRSELGVQSITEILDIYRTNWHGHLLRMGPYRVPLQVYRYRPTGRRNNVGRPRKRWKEQF